MRDAPFKYYIHCSLFLGLLLFSFYSKGQINDPFSSCKKLNPCGNSGNKSNPLVAEAIQNSNSLLMALRSVKTDPNQSLSSISKITDSRNLTEFKMKLREKILKQLISQKNYAERLVKCGQPNRDQGFCDKHIKDITGLIQKNWLPMRLSLAQRSINLDCLKSNFDKNCFSLNRVIEHPLAGDVASLQPLNSNEKCQVSMNFEHAFTKDSEVKSKFPNLSEKGRPIFEKQKNPQDSPNYLTEKQIKIDTRTYLKLIEEIPLIVFIRDVQLTEVKNQGETCGENRVNENSPAESQIIEASKKVLKTIEAQINSLNDENMANYSKQIAEVVEENGLFCNSAENWYRFKKEDNGKPESFLEAAEKLSQVGAIIAGAGCAFAITCPLGGVVASGLAVVSGGLSVVNNGINYVESKNRAISATAKGVSGNGFVGAINDYGVHQNLTDSTRDNLIKGAAIGAATYGMVKIRPSPIKSSPISTREKAVFIPELRITSFISQLEKDFKLSKDEQELVRKYLRESSTTSNQKDQEKKVVEALRSCSKTN